MLIFKKIKKGQASIEFMLCFLVTVALITVITYGIKTSTEKFHDNYKLAFLKAKATELEMNYNEAKISSTSVMMQKSMEIIGYDDKIFAKSGNEIFQIKTLNLERRNYA